MSRGALACETHLTTQMRYQNGEDRSKKTYRSRTDLTEGYPTVRSQLVLLAYPLSQKAFYHRQCMALQFLASLQLLWLLLRRRPVCGISKRIEATQKDGATYVVNL